MTKKSKCAKPSSQSKMFIRHPSGYRIKVAARNGVLVGLKNVTIIVPKNKHWEQCATPPQSKTFIFYSPDDGVNVKLRQGIAFLWNSKAAPPRPPTIKHAKNSSSFNQMFIFCPSGYGTNVKWLQEIAYFFWRLYKRGSLDALQAEPMKNGNSRGVTGTIPDSHTHCCVPIALQSS